MEIVIPGKGSIRLTPTDFKASGGEGSVYCRGGVAYKLYGQTDASGKFIANIKKMIPAGKIQELGVLDAPNIVKPEEIILDRSGCPVGYTMRALPDAIPLCQTFTKAFRNRKQISVDHMLKLVQQLQTGVKHVHSRDILIVDMNEMNFLVGKNFDQLYFIDVDSYQTEHFPATAIMDTVRDRHNARFSQKTDWFSFAIVSFQMQVGIHPFKGKHPSLQTLDQRMLGNVSVLNKDVTIPGACQSFDVIPRIYRDWYTAVFERGERIPPPDIARGVAVLTPVVKHIPGSDNFLIEEVGVYDGPIIAVVGNHVLTPWSVWAGAHRISDLPPGCVLGVTPLQNHCIAAWIERSQLRLRDLTRQKALDICVNADEIMACDGRIYTRRGDLLMQISLTEMPAKLLAGADIVGTVLGQATQLHEGVAVQSLLGATYLGLLPGSGQMHEVRVPELDAYRIIDARFDRGVFVATGHHRSGRYDTVILRFDASLRRYDARIVQDVTPSGINFTVLDTGIAALLNDEEKLELFAGAPGSPGLKVVGDKGIDGSCRLFSRGAQALIARANSLYKITMRKTT